MKSKPLYFSKHLLKRMAQRGISKAIVNVVVENGVWSNGKDSNSFEVEYKGIIVLLFEQKAQYNVGTCKLNRENTQKAEFLKEQKGIEFSKAMHRIVKSIDLTEEINRLN